MTIHFRFASCGVLLLVVVVLLLSLTHKSDAFVPISAPFRRDLVLYLQEKEFNIDSVMDEAESALLAAEEALKQVETTTTPPAFQKDTPVNTNTIPSSDPLAPEIASTLGAFGVGAVVGGLLELGFDAAVFQAAESTVLVPVLMGAGLAAVTYSRVRKEDETAQLIKGTVGKATNTAVSGVSSAAERAAKNAADEVKAVPGKVATAARNKVDETVEDLKSEIEAMPRKVATAAKNKVDETVEEISSEIKAVPKKVATAASRKAKETAEEIRQIPVRAADSAKKRAQEVVEEVRATPSRVATTTKKAVEATVDSIASNTKKKLEEIQESTLSALERAEKEMTAPKAPAPETTPVPPAEVTSFVSETTLSDSHNSTIEGEQ